MFPVLSISARRQALLIAVLAAASIVAQWVYLMGHRSTGPVETLIDMARFFTILTMALVTIAFGTLALSESRGLSAPLNAALTLSAIITGAAYHVLLADAWNPTGLGVYADLGLHTVVPVAVALWWLLYAPKTELRWGHLPAFLVWPAVYTAYALGLGAVDGTYPYPFMNPTLDGWQPVIHTLGALTAALVVGAAIMIAIGRFADR